MSNNCETCQHKANPQGGHCYMFKTEPSEKCMQHTERKALNIGTIGHISRRGNTSLLAVALAAIAAKEQPK
jgi:hypothetical protein